MSKFVKVLLEDFKTAVWIKTDTIVKLASVDLGEQCNCCTQITTNQIMFVENGFRAYGTYVIEMPLEDAVAFVNSQ